MLIFLDTEFTDFIDCDLISIGMVSENGQYVFYAERNDYQREWVSDFARLAVLPHVGHSPEAICSREQLTQRLLRWFSLLPGRVRIACDSMHDRDLLWDALEGELPDNLDSGRYDLAPFSEEAAFRQAVFGYHSQTGHPWHHSLHDAHAHRLGWVACASSNMGPASRTA